MERRCRYRLYPHPHGKTALAKAFGRARFVRNDTLAPNRELYKQGQRYPGAAELQKQCITQARRTQQQGWLAEVGNIPLQQSIRTPRFKKKHNTRSARSQRHGFRVEEHTLRLTKVGNSIPSRWSRGLPSAPGSVTVVKDSAARYFASFVGAVESTPHQPARSMADAGWGMFRTLLKGKAEPWGRVVVNRRLPASRTCSACGTGHDRDLNAAATILAAGLAGRLNACGAGSRAGLPASGLGAGTRLNQEGQRCTA